MCTYLHQGIRNLVVYSRRVCVCVVAAVEGEGDGLVGVAARLRVHLGRLGGEDGALVVQLVHVHNVLQIRVI